jgi:predicted ATPase
LPGRNLSRRRVAWLIETAERTPVLMVCEDLHWADPTTLETLGMLIEQAPMAALLVVAIYAGRALRICDEPMRPVSSGRT